MPLPLNSILQIELHLRNVPEDLSPAEKQRQVALTAISYLGSLGRVTSNLTTTRMTALQMTTDYQLEDRQEEFDAALFVLGDLQAVFADVAYGAVEEMFTELSRTDLPATPKAEPRVTTARRVSGTGRARTYKQRRDAAGHYVGKSAA